MEKHSFCLNTIMSTPKCLPKVAKRHAVFIQVVLLYLLWEGLSSLEIWNTELTYSSKKKLGEETMVHSAHDKLNIKFNGTLRLSSQLEPTGENKTHEVNTKTQQFPLVSLKSSTVCQTV